MLLFRTRFITLCVHLALPAAVLWWSYYLLTYCNLTVHTYLVPSEYLAVADDDDLAGNVEG
jgi:hypothetical protein